MADPPTFVPLITSKKRDLRSPAEIALTMLAQITAT
jgi:hypothetical protein